MSEGIADDGDPGAGVVKEEFVLVRAQKGVNGNGDGADLDGAEKGVSKLRDVGKEKKDAFFDADIQCVAEGIAETINALGELGVGDALVTAFDGHALGAAFAEMAVNEVVGGVETRLILSVDGGHGERV